MTENQKQKRVLQAGVQAHAICAYKKVKNIELSHIQMAQRPRD